MASLGLGVLTWRSPKNLAATLRSHKESGIFDLLDQRLVFVQEGDEESVGVAKAAGYEVASSPENLGILGGFEALGQSMRTDHIILNENDFPIVEPPEVVRVEIPEAQKLLEEGTAKVILMRSRDNPGEPFELVSKFEQFFPKDDAPVADRLKAKLRHLMRPEKARRMASRGLRLRKDADQLAPFAITRIAPEWCLTTSKWQTWSNNPFMVEHSFFMELIDFANKADTHRRTNGFKNFEIELNCDWWRDQEFPIAQGRGLFAHARIGYRGY